MKKALLMSSSKVGNMGYLEHADEQIHTILEHKELTVLFIPYASVAVTYDDFEAIVKEPFVKLGYNLKSIHHFDDPVVAVKNADAIAVGGGNTFVLLRRMYDARIVDVIRERVEKDGIPYLGWSAGSNVAGPTIRTTNDMPIIEPPTLDAIGLISFQVNPHFILGKPASHNGESREERLNEFLCINPDETLLAIKEGTALFVEGNQGTLLGELNGLHFLQSGEIEEIPVNQRFDLSMVKGPKK